MAAFFANSERFQHCIGENKNHKPYNALHQKASLAEHAFVRFELNASCAAGDTDVLTALSGIAVAFFTLTLWRSTDALRISADGAGNIAERQALAIAELHRIATEQTAILERQTRITERHSTVYGPIFGMEDPQQYVVVDVQDDRIIKRIEVSFTMRNYGKTIAKHACYRIGEVEFCRYIEASDKDWMNTAHQFVNNIFHTELHLGDTVVPPDKTIETDRKIFTVDKLRDLFSKRERAFLWCVLTCGSPLEDESWFSETALLLEFIMVEDPDHFGGDMPMRIATRAERYRQGHYSESLA